VIVTGVLVPTAEVDTANVALVDPAGTVTLAGTLATAVLLLDSDTTAPPLGAPEVSVAVPVEPVPPVTLEGFTETADSEAGAAGGVTESVAVRVTPSNVALTTADVDALTALVEIVKLALLLPAGTVTLAGTVATPALLLESDTSTPPDGAAAVSVTVPCDVLPPTTVAGFTVNEESAKPGDTFCSAVSVEPLYVARMVDPAT